MRNRVTLSLSFMAFAISFAVSGSALAHHGAAAYDSSKMVTVTGTVTDFQFINPHVMIAMDVKDPSTGKLEKWEGELTSPNHLERAGWTKSTIKPGDELTMTGAALKSGAPAMAIRKVMKNGQEIGLMGGSDN
jgi:hypothetical protein